MSQYHDDREMSYRRMYIVMDGETEVDDFESSKAACDLVLKLTAQGKKPWITERSVPEY